VSRLLPLKPYRRIELNVNSIRPIESIRVDYSQLYYIIGLLIVICRSYSLHCGTKGSLVMCDNVLAVNTGWWCRGVLRVVRQRAPLPATVVRRKRTHCHSLRHRRPGTLGRRGAADYHEKWRETRGTPEARWRWQRTTFGLRKNPRASQTTVRTSARFATYLTIT